MVHSKLSLEEGRDGAEYLLSLPNPPDGIFAANDSAAVSAIQYAKQKGLNVPQELAVVGFNDDPIASIIEPDLTTVSHPAFDMGKIAAQQVLKSRDKHNSIVQSQTIVLKTDLVIRASSMRTTVTHGALSTQRSA